MKQGILRQVLLASFILFSALIAQHVNAVENNAAPTPTATPSTSRTINPQSEQQIVQVATEALMKVFNYNYQNYQQVFNNAKQYFTDHGWRSFRAAIERSQNIKAVVAKKIFVSAKLIGKATLIEHSKQQGREHWIVTVPLDIKYTGTNFNSDHEVKATVSIIKDTKNKTIGVDQLVVEPLAPATATTTAQP